MEKIKSFEDFRKYYIWVETKEECEEIYNVLKSKFNNVKKDSYFGTKINSAPAHCFYASSAGLNNYNDNWVDNRTRITIDQLKEMLSDDEDIDTFMGLTIPDGLIDCIKKDPNKIDFIKLDLCGIGIKLFDKVTNCSGLNCKKCVCSAGQNVDSLKEFKKYLNITFAKRENEPQKENGMHKEFDKSMLESGDILTLRDGFKCMVISYKNYILGYSKSSLMDIKGHLENLEDDNYKRFDIIEVRRPKHQGGLLQSRWNDDEFTELIWQRKETKNITVEEAQQLLNENSDVEYKIEV